MTTLYTAYGFRADQATNQRPVGMNTLVYLSRKPATPAQQREVCKHAASRVNANFATVVFFQDDKAIRTIEL